GTCRAPGPTFTMAGRLPWKGWCIISIAASTPSSTNIWTRTCWQAPGRPGAWNCTRTTSAPWPSSFRPWTATLSQTLLLAHDNEPPRHRRRGGKKHREERVEKDRDRQTCLLVVFHILSSLCFFPR